MPQYKARICIEDALVNKGVANRAAELVERCEEELDEMLLYMWKGLGNMNSGSWGDRLVFPSGLLRGYLVAECLSSGTKREAI